MLRERSFNHLEPERHSLPRNVPLLSTHMPENNGNRSWIRSPIFNSLPKVQLRTLHTPTSGNVVKHDPWNLACFLGSSAEEPSAAATWPAMIKEMKIEHRMQRTSIKLIQKIWNIHKVKIIQNMYIWTWFNIYIYIFSQNFSGIRAQPCQCHSKGWCPWKVGAWECQEWKQTSKSQGQPKSHSPDKIISWAKVNIKAFSLLCHFLLALYL